MTFKLLCRYATRVFSFRYGFNSVGHDAVFGRLSAIRYEKQTLSNTCICTEIYIFRSDEGKAVNVKIGVNLGKNKTSSDPVKDYVDGVKKFGDVADYLVVNVSRLVAQFKLFGRF